MSERVDKWLFSIRVYKSRSQATQACTLGRVKVNEQVVKPAAKITVGDRIEIRRRDRILLYEVVTVIDRRVSPTLAAECVIDLSPRREGPGSPNPAPVARRDRGAGRPTKRERREIDAFRVGPSASDT